MAEQTQQEKDAAALKAKQEADAKASADLEAKKKADEEAKAKAAGLTGAQSYRDYLKGNVLLTFTDKRAWIIHLPQSGGLLAAIARNSDPNAVMTQEELDKMLLEQKPLTIIPNTNEYPAHIWEQVKNHPDVKRALADGRLILQTKESLGQVPAPGETGKAPAKQLPATLTNLEVAKALQLADNCDDAKILDTWLKAETGPQGQNRSTVRDKLKAKLEEVKENDAKFQIQ